MMDPAQPVDPEDPFFWQSLLNLMDKGRVIPVVGPDAVIIDGALGPRPLTEYLAPLVERILGLPPGDPPATELEDVACRYLQRAGSQKFSRLYGAVMMALEELGPQQSEPLRKLARIGAFKLFVTTTFDDLLFQALAAERPGGVEAVKTFAYWPEKTEDLPAAMTSFAGPVVYHLFGRVSPAPEFAVTEEDTLEFIHSLQSNARQPARLMEELKPASLLVLGSRYSDWLARFFLRVVKAERLLKAVSKPEVVAENTVDAATGLGRFLRHYSSETLVYPDGPVAFIDRLSERWAQHTARRREPQVPVGGPPVAEHAIFISYASEDRDHAKALEKALIAERLPVWLDSSDGLKGGEAFDNKIRQQIQVSSIFVALLTPVMTKGEPRYFRTEWEFARERGSQYSEAMPFVVPVRVGAVPPSTPHIDEYIRKLHWMEVSEEGDEQRFAAVVARLKQIYREYRDTKEGLA